MRASSKCSYVESSSVVTPPSPPSSSDPTAEEYVDPMAVVDPPPSTTGDSSIQSMLATIMTVQAAHGQLLVDVLMELQVMRADLASIRWTPPPSPFDDES